MTIYLSWVARVALVVLLWTHDHQPRWTPGKADPRLTARVLCAPGFTTSRYRPPLSYTEGIKQHAIRQWNELTGSQEDPKDFELDHLIPLELGGDGYSGDNLWLQPYQPWPGAHEKDLVENYLHAEVCQHDMPLVEAQYLVVYRWEEVYFKLWLSRRVRS